MHLPLNRLSHYVALTVRFKVLIIWKSPSIQILSKVFRKPDRRNKPFTIKYENAITSCNIVILFS